MNKEENTDDSVECHPPTYHVEVKNRLCLKGNELHDLTVVRCVDRCAVGGLAKTDLGLADVSITCKRLVGFCECLFCGGEKRLFHQRISESKMKDGPITNYFCLHKSVFFGIGKKNAT